MASVMCSSGGMQTLRPLVAAALSVADYVGAAAAAEAACTHLSRPTLGSEGSATALQCWIMLYQ
jgi:hypothetical protein